MVFFCCYLSAILNIREMQVGDAINCYLRQLSSDGFILNFCTVKIGNKFWDFSWCLRHVGHHINTPYFLVKLCIVGYTYAIEQGFF